MESLRIMVFDDDPMISSLLDMMLTDMGHEVCAVEETEAGAVAAAARYRPDLMIVDARLGEGSGVAAVETILKSGKIAYVLISGTAVPAARTDAVVLMKPFQEAGLARSMDRAIAAAPSARLV